MAARRPLGHCRFAPLYRLANDGAEAKGCFVPPISADLAERRRGMKSVRVRDWLWLALLAQLVNEDLFLDSPR